MNQANRMNETVSLLQKIIHQQDAVIKQLTEKIERIEKQKTIIYRPKCPYHLLLPN